MQESCCTCARLLPADSPSAAPEPFAAAAAAPASPEPPSHGASAEVGVEKQHVLMPATHVLPDDRRLDCCDRIICSLCIRSNARFAAYCPYCQVSSVPSVLPPGLKDPPVYTAMAIRRHQTTSDSALDAEAPPPPYTPENARNTTTNSAAMAAATFATDGREGLDEKKAGSLMPDSASCPPEHILHFLDHNADTVLSLSLRYRVPAAAIRQANRLGSDHLLMGRRTVVIPIPGRQPPASSSCFSSSSPSAIPAGGDSSGQPVATSLSPRPPEGEAEETRKARIRRWMVATKVADYDVALLYLEQAGHDLEAAVEAYAADEAWEKAHPLPSGTCKGKGKVEGGRFSGPAASSGFGVALPGARARVRARAAWAGVGGSMAWGERDWDWWTMKR